MCKNGCFKLQRAFKPPIRNSCLVPWKYNTCESKGKRFPLKAFHVAYDDCFVATLDATNSARLSTLFDIGGIIGGIFAGAVSDATGMSASTCSGMLVAAVPMVSLLTYTVNLKGHISFSCLVKSVRRISRLLMSAIRISRCCLMVLSAKSESNFAVQSA